MKLTARLLKATTVCLAALALATGAEAQTRDIQAVVRSLSGTATFSNGGQGGLPVRVGARIPAGSVIRTGPGSSMDLFLGRGAGVLRISENTTLGLDKLTVTDTGSDLISETLLSIPEGEVLGNVNKISAGSHYEMKTPDGLAGVRGGRFQIRVPGPITVLDGTLVFVKGNTAHIIKGPGRYNPNANTGPVPLSPDEIPVLNQRFQGTDTPANAASLPVPPPPPQEIPTSTVFGT